MNFEIWSEKHSRDLYNLYKIFLNELYKFNNNIDKLESENKYNFPNNLNLDYFESNEFIDIFKKFLYNNK